MRVYKVKNGAIVVQNNQFFTLEVSNWDVFLNRTNLHRKLLNDLIGAIEIDDVDLENPEIPIGTQEIWAAGVTYLKSKDARMEESKKAGAASFYDQVYDADRPELFFKANALRTVGHNGTVRIRKDSKWNVPEPELTLLLSSQGTIEGYTIGNDMSSRSIEGENPLYLPQAKTYDGCAALGPCIYVLDKPIPVKTSIRLDIKRKNKTVFTEEIQLGKMKRKLQDLVDYLFRECTFPNGCFLMTGTGIIPPDDFTLAIGDETQISIEGIGTLTNVVGK